MTTKKKEETVWTEELLRERRKRATIMAIALLAFIALFLVALIKLGANVANRPLLGIHAEKPTITTVTMPAPISVWLRARRLWR